MLGYCCLLYHSFGWGEAPNWKMKNKRTSHGPETITDMGKFIYKLKVSDIHDRCSGSPEVRLYTVKTIHEVI